MYSPIAQKTAASIMYRKQLVARAKSMPLGDLEQEIRNYEQIIETPDTKGIFRRFVDYFTGVDVDEFNQYQANRLVLRERVSSE